MRWMVYLAICGVVAPAMMTAQTSAKSKKTAAATTQPAPATSEELNIQAYIEFLRSDLRNGKTQIISDVMALDADQAAAFWPIYKEFETSYTKIGDDILALVKSYVQNYDTLTNELADQLATKLLDIEQNRNELKRQYYGKFKVALDPITAARFLQVENQLEKLMDLQIASQLPVAGGPGK